MSTREQPSTSELVAAWFEGDWDVDRFTWFADQVWHPEIEWRAIEGAPDDVGPIHGVERLARYYGEWAELFDDIHQEVREQHDIGGRGVLAMHVTARARSTSMPLELDYAVVCDVRDGRLVSGREYATLDEALSAVNR